MERDYQFFKNSFRYQQALQKKLTGMKKDNSLGRLNTGSDTGRSYSALSNYAISPPNVNPGHVHDLYRKIAQSLEQN